MSLYENENAATVKDDDIIDIDLSAIRKKRFRIDGDNSKILELNTSDLNVINRFKEVYDKILTLTADIADKKANMTEDTDVFMQEVKKIDEQLREYLDYVYDAPVSEVCAGQGTMCDMFNGRFRFEYILDKLSPLYGDNFKNEVATLNKRISTHTAKYTAPKKKHV